MLRVFTSRRCLAHTAPGGYPERPERLLGILEHLRRLGGGGGSALPASLVEEPDAAPIAPAAIRAVHDERYVRRLEAAVARGDGLIDSADNPLSAGTWDAAMAAVEVTLAAGRWVAGEGEEGGGGGTAGERHAFAAVRPPGHHAEHDRAMGFCYFANLAVAAEDWIASGAARRVAIVDFDVHHGNGTQHIFEERPDVFFASLHQWPFYPGTGAAAERGRGAGEGATLNVPLPRGTGDAELLAAMDGEVLPALDRFAPDLLAVSAGFDAWRGDPLGGFRLGEEAFREIGRRMRQVARQHCGGRSLTVLEGGYDLAVLPRLVEVYLEGLSGGPEGAPGAARGGTD